MQQAFQPSLSGDNVAVATFYNQHPGEPNFQHLFMKNDSTQNIQGKKFSGTCNENFQQVKAGHRKFQKLFLGILGISAISLGSTIFVYAGSLIRAVLYSSIADKYKYLFVGFFIISLYIWIKCGFKFATISGIGGGILIAAIIVINFENIGDITEQALYVGFSIGLACLGTIVTAFYIVFNSISWGFLGEFISISVAVLLAAISITRSVDSKVQLVILTLMATFPVIITSAIIARQAMKGSPKFAWIREQAVFWAATGGTSFYKVDLTDACFDGAHLPHTDFREATLTRASFKNVTGLELSRLQGTILENPKIRRLLTHPEEGWKDDYTGADLSGANLRGANLTMAILKDANLSNADLREAHLEEAILAGANLNGADLRGASLEGANLAKAQVLDADFSEAVLTDACIQDWSINKGTLFKNVDCKRVYVKRGKRGPLEPKPDSGEFQPGEFEQWIDQLKETVDIIIQQKLNWNALSVAFAKTAAEQDGLDGTYSLEKKSDGVTVAKVGVVPGADKAAIHQTITNYYFNEVSIQAEKANLLLNPATEVEFMESKHEFSVGGNISIGGDMTGSSLAGDLNQVTNTIQQLQEVKTGSSDELAKILTALKDSIAEDAELSETQKKEALEAVGTIAEEAKKPPAERAGKYCSMALNALKGVTAAVTDASKLGEVLKTCLPTLIGLLGL